MFLASNHRNVGLTVLQTFMAGELFQGLQAMSLFTAAESEVLAMIPSIAAAAGLKDFPHLFENKEDVSRVQRFEQHKFLQIWTPPGGYIIRIPQFLSKIEVGFGIRDAEILQTIIIAAIRTACLQRGHLVSYSRSNLYVIVPYLIRVRLLTTKHRHYADIGENSFISYAPASDSRRQHRVFARVRFLCVIESSARKLQVLIFSMRNRQMCTAS